MNQTYGGLDGLVGWVVAAGAAAAAGYAIWRYVVQPIARAVSVVVEVGGDFRGHDERPGVPRKPGVMERLQSIEQQIKVNGTGLPLGEATAQLLKKTDALEQGRQANAAGIAELKDGQEAAREAAQVAAERTKEVHAELHTWIEEGQVREQAYLASLAELGIDIEPQPTRDPHSRTRETDL